MGLFSAIANLFRSIGTKVATHSSNIGNKVKTFHHLWKPSVPKPKYTIGGFKEAVDPATIPKPVLGAITDSGGRLRTRVPFTQRP